MIVSRSLFRLDLFLLSSALVVTPPSLAASAPNSLTYDRTVVRVVTQSAAGEILGTGSGFFVDERHVVTNHHVVADGELPPNPLISVVLAGGRDWLPVNIRWTDVGLDLAVLEAPPGQDRSSLALRLTEPARGADVYAVGYPGSADRASGDVLQSTLTDGILSKPPFEAQWGTPGSGLLRVLQHTAAISPGSSGGPLLDACGNALGVNTSGGLSEVHDASGNVIGATAAQGIFFALDASELARELDRLGVQYVPAGACDATDQPPPNTREAGPESSKLYLWLVGLVAVVVVGALHLYRRSHRPDNDARAGTSPASSPASGAVAPAGIHMASDSTPRTGTIRLVSQSAAPHLTVDVAELRRAEHGLSLGRQPDLVDQSLAVEGLSRRHFRISVDRGRVWLEDLNSTNGTFVNGEQLVPYRARQLRAGDEIAAGSGCWRVAGSDAVPRQHD